ncbi:glycine zipper family protein [Catellatospora sp. NPDC049111]|uniref:glycine zipper family protein n=1 Tax=Catellatospora sp. NPDC049111 TaxID=3155271 RepID=UPI0033DB56A8
MAAVAAGSLLGAGWAVFAGVVIAVVAVPYGWAVGRVRAYPASPRGVALFAVDHSWSLVNTIAGAGFLAVNLARGHHLDPPRCCHRGRIDVHEQAIQGYATTLGNVVAGGTAANERHEDLHVRQARLLGPLYLPLVGLNYALFSVLPVWWFYHDHDGYPITGPGRYFTRGVYLHVWHEAWAYRRDVRDRYGDLPVPRPGRRRSRRVHRRDRLRRGPHDHGDRDHCTTDKT